MRCSSCESDNPPGMKFCGNCGSPLKSRCPKCGFENPPQFKFCGECATPLGTPDQSNSPGTSHRPSERIRTEQIMMDAPDAAAGERKNITALFADIKGSMELIEDLDPEEARGLVDPTLKLMIDAVQRYEGYVAQQTGDGIFALFGAPIAHEDHPQRALLASLKMQEDIKQYSTKLREEGRTPIEIRVGINTGEVVVRAVHTGENRAEYTPIGHSTSLAARMQALAPTGSIAVSEQTRKLVEGYFAFKPLGPARVKGVSELVNVFELTGLGPLRTRLQMSARRGLSRFVGRDREIDEMKRAMEKVSSGRGQIVAAMGEAGLGKSRLFHEFKAIASDGCLALEAFSVSHGKASAYMPLIDLLWNYFEITAEDDERKRREKVTGKVLALDRALEDTLVWLFSLLQVSEAADSIAQMDPKIKQQRTLEAVKRLLLRESLNQPLILVFEDLHWVDAGTQVFLNLMADGLATAQILLMVNYRPEYRHEWTNKSNYTQLRLDPLGKESAEEMLSALVGDSPELLPLKRLTIERTEGNPFFMEETMQVLFDEGALVRNGAVRLIKPLNELKIPPTVRGILTARIDRLAPEEKALLQALSVIGKEFRLGLLKQVVGEPDDELRPMLNDLQLREFIYEQPAFPEAEYTFKHALTQEVAYNSVLVERRRLLHRLTGAAIESLYSDRLEDYYAELARHYRHSDDIPKALHYLRLAAEQAVGRSAYTAAAGDVKAALALASGLPDQTERLRAELALHRSEALVATALHGIGSHEREHAIQRVCEISERLGDTKSLLHASIYLSLLYVPRGEPLRAREMCRRHIELAEKSSDEEILAFAHRAIVIATLFAGDLNEMIRLSHQWAKRFENTPQHGYPFNLAVTLPAHKSVAVHLLGRGSEAFELCRNAMERSQALRDPFTLGMTASSVAWVTQMRRDLEAARDVADVLWTTGEEHGFSEWREWGRWGRGWVIAELGDTEHGLAEMEAALAGFVQIGGTPRHPYAVALMAKSYGKLGRIDQALAMLEHHLARLEHTGERLDGAEVHRAKGELLYARDGEHSAEAESCLRKALAVARQQEARWWELRAAISLARMLMHRGNRDDARAVLSQTYGWFVEGFELPDLIDAKALLDDLNA